MNLATALLELDVPQHRPGFFDHLRDELTRAPRTGGAPRRLLLVAAAAAVAAAAVAFGLTRGSEVASAAQVRAAVERALASPGTISGTFVNSDNPPASGAHERFTFTSTGASRIEWGNGINAERTYDPVTNVESNWDGFFFVRNTGLAPGPPDEAPADSTPVLALGSVVAALASADDPKVEDVTFDGRPAWQLSAPTGKAGELRRITVDRQTGFPVGYEVARGRKVTSAWRLEGLRVTSTVKTIEPLEPRPGEHVNTFDAGFRRVSPDTARKLAHYAPLVPHFVPAGFTLAAVAFAAHSSPTGDGNPSNPPSRDVISFLYRRGFDEIIVTTRRTGASATAWRDPLQVSTAVTSTPKRFVFTGGKLTGQAGRLVLEPDSLPHIWSVGPKLVVTIAGTVDGRELGKIANSLHAYGS